MNHMKNLSKLAIILIGFSILLILSNCATSTATPNPTTTPFSFYGYTYKKYATPNLPPHFSIGMSIWGEDLPVIPIESTPQFIYFPTPVTPSDTPSLLNQAGCQLTQNSFIQCDNNSPLNRFDCQWLLAPKNISFGLVPNYPLVAECQYLPINIEETRDELLYRVGCLSTKDLGYIFYVNNDYVLINTVKKMQELFAPIESAEEALNYAQLITGLDTLYEFSAEQAHAEEFVYFQQIIEGTHVTVKGSAFELNLYHSQICGCDTWTTSQVNLLIDHSGSITWEGASPIYLRVDNGCID
jgi:hypothetical protein